ncbi:hypothetical protein VTJ04DRAFT_9595 [Mycothermus thermophilus]|uniref:uncharacterized protein n=1 Tax=Humicola insolens TaxID=85995 RepID=UPI0037428D7A
MKFQSSLLAAGIFAGAASAIGPAGPIPPRLEGNPEKMANWRWKNPFENPHLSKFDVVCEVEATVPAREHLLDDLGEKGPNGLLLYRDALRSVFATRQYPGAWDGIDPHGYDRLILTMHYVEMPLKVREWIEEQERSDGPGKGLFAVYPIPSLPGARAFNTIKVPKETPVPEEWRARDKGRIALFAPGALYEILPLFVAEGSKCEEALSDLSKYSPHLVDGGVIAYPIEHTTPDRKAGERDIDIKIKAQVLKLKEGETAPPIEEEKKEEKKSEAPKQVEEAKKEEKKEEAEKAETKTEEAKAESTEKAEKAEEKKAEEAKTEEKKEAKSDEKDEL